MNPFEVFKYEEKYDISREKLEVDYIALISRNHPDNFPDDKRQGLIATAFSMKINDSYRILKDDILRAKFMLSKAGFIFEGDKKNINPDPDFLEYIMDLNEELIKNASQTLNKITDELGQKKQEILEFFAANDLENAAKALLKIIYFDGIIKHSLVLK